jgi:hypothetical protein
MKIGIKYCGGCNPGFDRTDLVRKIKKELKDIVEFVSTEDSSIEGLLVVEGCSTACVDLEAFKHQKIFLIKDPEEAEIVIRDILSLGGRS